MTRVSRRGAYGFVGVVLYARRLAATAHECLSQRERAPCVPQRDRRSLTWSEPRGRDLFEEGTIADYLAAYQERAQPAPATYDRRFVLLRRFLRWVSRRAGVPDPFLDLEPPPKSRQERDWLTREEFRRLLDAATRPQRNLPGLAERAELCAIEW